MEPNRNDFKNESAYLYALIEYHDFLAGAFYMHYTEHTEKVNDLKKKLTALNHRQKPLNIIREFLPGKPLPKDFFVLDQNN